MSSKTFNTLRIPLILTFFFIPSVHAGPLEPNQPMHYTVGNDVGFIFMDLDQAQQNFNKSAAADRKNKLTAYESYVKWRVCNPEPNKWDFSYYEMAENVCVKNGLKWVPFLIAPSAWATPKWFKNSEKSVFAVNLINGKKTLTQSIWNPHVKPYIENFIKKFSVNFDHSNMQSVLLGPNGDFGESIYPAVANTWTYKYDGKYYSEPGWWCGDKYAVMDFRNSMKKKYQNIAKLNYSWKVNFDSFQDVRPFVPTSKWSRRARLDFIHWYTVSMTDFTEFWVKTAVKYFPNTQVMICTGGDARPQLGADFSNQAKIAKKYDAGIRITNEASDYVQNYTLTRWVGSACKNYSIFFGYEPAGRVDNNGIVARIYNAVASGADELFIYDNPPLGIRAKIYEQNLKWLIKQTPIVKIAVFLPKTSVWLEQMTMEDFYYKKSGKIRDYTDFDYLDQTLIADDCLENYSVLLWPDGTIAEKYVIEKIKKWLKKGNRLYLNEPIETVEGKIAFSRNKAPENCFFIPKPYDKFMKEICKKESKIISDGKKDNIFHTNLKKSGKLILNFNDQPKIYLLKD